MSTAQTVSPARPERVDLILNQLDQLPTLPVIATRVLQATGDERSTAAEVIRLIESDQSLSAKILRMVHQASRGAPRDVDTVGKAVVLLGFNAVRHAVLSIKVFDTFASSGTEHSHFDRREFWKHSLAVGCAAYLVAQKWSSRIDAEVAFVCGLLHDLGKVALDACLPKSYDRVISVALRRGRCILDVEQELLGVDHTVAGKRMAQRWKLPPNLIECIWLHHHTPDMLPESVAHPELVQVVNLADTLAREQRLGFSGYIGDGTGSVEIARQMGLPTSALEEIVPNLLPAIEDRAALLGLDQLTSGEIYAEAVSHANEELGRLNQALGETHSRLAARSSYLELIHRFNERLDIHMSVLDICEVAADAARQLLDLDTVAVFASHPERAFFHVVVQDVDGVHSELVEAVTPLDPPSDTEATILPAPAATAVIREHCGVRMGSGPHWLLPIIKQHRVIGGVLFEAPQDHVTQLDAHHDELHMFATALAVAMRSGFQRMTLERLNEGLAQVNRQLKVAQTELLQRRSLSMIGEMAAGAAHELNNPLAVIAGRSELLADSVTDERDAKGLRIINEQAHRASAIVNDLMEFAKPDAPARGVLDLEEILRASVSELGADYGLAADQVIWEISDVPLQGLADPRQARALLVEILRNALDAMTAETARLTIKGHRDVADEKVIVTIEDNGVGMTPDVLDKARDPFFSHRQAGRGRGLGLSRAARWCDINGGRLRLESEPQVGTRVWIEFDAPQPD